MVKIKHFISSSSYPFFPSSVDRTIQSVRIFPLYDQKPNYIRFLYTAPVDTIGLSGEVHWMAPRIFSILNANRKDKSMYPLHLCAFRQELAIAFVSFIHEPVRDLHDHDILHGRLMRALLCFRYRRYWICARFSCRYRRQQSTPFYEKIGQDL